MPARSFGRIASALLGAAVMAGPAHAEQPLAELEAVRAYCSAGSGAAWARAKRQEGAAHVSAAAVLPNPALVVEHQRSLQGPADRETVVGLSLPLSISGRRGLLQDAAQARREQSVAEGNAALFEGALELRAAYARALVAQARADIAREQQELLDASSAVIEALHGKGEAATYDLLRQQLQARVHRGSLAAAEAEAAAAQALLQAWTGKAVVLAAVSLSELAQAQPELAIVAEPQPAELRALRAEAQASSLQARAARRRWLPDPEVFAGYRALDTGAATAHGFSASISIPLTFFDHGQGEAALSEAERSLAEASIDRVRSEQSAAERAARARLEALLQGYQGVARLGEDARQLTSRARQLYAAGESSIAEMLDAFRAAEEARLALAERVLEIALARLQVMRATGTMFDPQLDRVCSLTQQGRP